jgi:dTDP-glucose pyrophosphorylase
MIDWKRCVLGPNDSVQDAIRNLNETASRVVLIANEEMRFLGIVVDGDIRRGLLRGVTLADRLDTVMNHSAKTTLDDCSHIDALALMKELNIEHLPITDENGTLCGLFSNDSARLNPDRSNEFMIMAGGFGRRMGPETERKPKPMLEIGGKPILEHLIYRARDAGFVNFTISVHHLGRYIEEYFREGKRHRVRIKYVHEDQPLGTAGSIAYLDPRPDGPIVISNADLISKVDYGAILETHINGGNSMTVAVQDYHTQNPFGVARISNGLVIDVVEKPVSVSKILAGMYVIDPRIIDLVPRGRFMDMPDLIRIAIEMNLKVCPFQMYEDWMDVGQQNDLVAARTKFANGGESDE